MAKRGASGQLATRPAAHLMNKELLLATLAIGAVSIVDSAFGQSGCCLVLPTAPNNFITVKVSYPASTSYDIVTVLDNDPPVLTVPPVAKGAYAAWCIDWYTTIFVSPS